MNTRKKSTFTLVKETPTSVDPSHDGREIQKEELLTRIGSKRIQHILLNGYCTNSRPIPKQTCNHFNQYDQQQHANTEDIDYSTKLLSAGVFHFDLNFL